MFTLYKERDFSAIFNDTFGFFKANGKSYFRNYFIVNGGLLLILALLIYLVGNVFFENVFAGLGNPQASQMMDDYFNGNANYFIGIGLVITVLIIIISLINYSFPVIYLELLSEGKEPDSAAIFRGVKKKVGKMFLFCLLSLVTFVPIMAIMGMLCVLLMFIIVGIPLAFIVLPAFFCWMFLSYYDYLSTNNSFFTSFGNGYTMLVKRFWPHMGATLLIYIIVYILQSILSFLPYLAGTFLILFDTSGNPGSDNLSVMGILLLTTLILSTLLTFIFSNITLISQGMIYYSCKEQDDNHSLHSEIDLIGSDIE